MNGNGQTEHPNRNGTTEHRELVATDRSAGMAPMRVLPDIEGGFSGRSQEDVPLAVYWHTLLKRRWTVVTVALVLATLAAIVSFRMTPIYKAVARVQVEAETPLIQSINELLQKPEADDAFLQTQIQILKSENLAWHTIEQLSLAQYLIKPEGLAKIEPEQRKVRLIAAFKNNVSVELTPKTRMLVVGFENRDPQLAAQVATTLVENYIDYNFRKKYDATRQASGWMEQQLDELKARVERSQQALVQYEREHQIVNINDKQNVVMQMLSDLSKDLTVAESERVQKEAFYREVLANRAQVAALAHNELLQKLEEKAADLNNQYIDTVAQYGRKYPKAERLQQQIDENQSQIEREQNRVIERIRKDYDAARNREKLATAAVMSQKEEVGKLNQLLVQHNILQRDFEGNQQLYQNLMQKLKDATVSAGLRSTNIHLVDTALPPVAAIRPRKLLNIAIGFLAGVILGIMGAFAQEGLDHSVKTAEEVETLLGIPALAVIPLERAASSARRTRFHRNYALLALLRRASAGWEKAAPNPRKTIGLVVTEKPQSVLAEAYRALRTSILLSLAPHAPKLLLITSTQAGEGKTATALNLSQVLAQRKGPVLIVDCDLRKGGIGKLLGVDNERGLSTFLTGKHSLTDVLQRYDPQLDLWVLPSGSVPPNPADLIGSDAMSELLHELSSRFEHVIIDSPPVLPVTDATILSSLVDGVVLITESGVTPRGGLMRSASILESAGARILGVVLNKFDPRQQGYYGNYGYYYTRYYHKYPYGRTESAG
jgi:capsular exopolysaccharide synthesis family protein